MSTVIGVNSTVRHVSIVVTLLVLLAACQRPEPDSAPLATPAPVSDTTTLPVSESTTTTSDAPVPSTSAAPESTVPATTPATSAPPTTEPEPATTVEPQNPQDLVLDFDGVLPFSFGGPDTEIVPGLVAVLGEPVSDESAEYPNDDEGTFLDVTGEEAYVAPFGRTVCFANGLCTEFGAGSDTALQFTGWRFEGDTAAGLASAGGITVGSLWVDHMDAITVEEGGCFTVGNGMAEGIDLTLESSGDPFMTVAADGSFAFGSPDPAAVSVIGMRAGDLPVLLFADC
ncbi:MAG: hypothetical protein ABIP17_05490 [Ilumatobacteraceae bacterium]